MMNRAGFPGTDAPLSCDGRAIGDTGPAIARTELAPLVPDSYDRGTVPGVASRVLTGTAAVR